MSTESRFSMISTRQMFAVRSFKSWGVKKKKEKRKKKQVTRLQWKANLSQTRRSGSDQLWKIATVIDPPGRPIHRSFRNYANLLSPPPSAPFLSRARIFLRCAETRTPRMPLDCPSESRKQGNGRDESTHERVRHRCCLKNGIEKIWNRRTSSMLITFERAKDVGSCIFSVGKWIL